MCVYELALCKDMGFLCGCDFEVEGAQWENVYLRIGMKRIEMVRQKISPFPAKERGKSEFKQQTKTAEK